MLARVFMRDAYPLNTCLQDDGTIIFKVQTIATPFTSLRTGNFVQWGHAQMVDVDQKFFLNCMLQMIPWEFNQCWS